VQRKNLEVKNARFTLHSSFFQQKTTKEKILFHSPKHVETA